MKRAVFLETESQVRAALERNENIDCWVALSLRALYELESRGIRALTLDQYIPNQEIDQAEKRLIEKVEIFYSQSGPFADIVNKFGELIIDVGGYELSRIIVQLEITLLKLDRFLETERPDQAIIFINAAADDANYEGYQIDNLYGGCLKLLAENYMLQVLELDYSLLPQNMYPQVAEPPHNYWKKFIAFLIQKKISLQRLLLTEHSKRKRILFLSLAYDLEFLVRDMLKKSDYAVALYPVTSWPGLNQDLEPLNYKIRCLSKSQNIEFCTEVERLAKIFWEDLKNDNRFRSFFSWRGKEYFNFIEVQLKKIFQDNIAQLNKYYPFHCNMLRTNKISAIISPYPQINPIAVSLWHAAAKLGIPFAVYQHGGIYGYLKLHRFRLFECKRTPFLSYGKGIEAQMRWSAVNPYKVYPVGSLKMSHYRRKPPGNSQALRGKITGSAEMKLVSFAADAIRVSWAGILQLQGSVPLYRLQIKLADLVSEFPGIHLAIKIHRIDRKYNPIARYIQDKKISNCSVHSEPSFLEFMPASDMIIFDHPGTAFLESQSLRCPVCVFTSGFEIYPEFRESLKKCVLFADDMDEFIAGLRDKFEKLLNNSTELREVMPSGEKEEVIMDDDGVLNRVYAAIETIAASKTSEIMQS